MIRTDNAITYDTYYRVFVPVVHRPFGGYCTATDLFPELPWHCRKGWYQEEDPGGTYVSFRWIDYNDGKSHAVMVAAAVRRLRALRITLKTTGIVVTETN